MKQTSYVRMRPSTADPLHWVKQMLLVILVLPFPGVAGAQSCWTTLSVGLCKRKYTQVRISRCTSANEETQAGIPGALGAPSCMP